MVLDKNTSIRPNKTVLKEQYFKDFSTLTPKLSETSLHLKDDELSYHQMCTHPKNAVAFLSL